MDIHIKIIVQQDYFSMTLQNSVHSKMRQDVDQLLPVSRNLYRNLFKHISRST